MLFARSRPRDCAPDLFVPPVAAAPDDVEAELARLSALLGVARGELAAHRRLVADAAATVSGYTLHPDDSVSLHFSSATELVDALAASLALGEAQAVLASATQLQLVVPESTR
jgi:hypothetical protein